MCVSNKPATTEASPLSTLNFGFPMIPISLSERENHVFKNVFN